MATTIADVQRRMPAQDFLNVFDIANAGAADATFTQQCLDDAQSEFDMALFAAFGTTLDAAPGAMDAAATRVVVVLAIRNGLQLNPLLTDSQAAPYQRAIKWAEAWIDKLVKDNKNRLVTKQPGLARPVAEVSNATNDAGATTSPYRAGADGEQNNGF